jgi:chromate transporter
VERSRFSLILETFRVFLRLGCTSFGGPVAHLGYFQNELVQRRRWVSDAAYADVIALCQCLPGPASSQVCFVLGYLHSGLLGGILGWIAFTAPSAVLMIGFAYGVHLLNVQTAGWLLGLKVAAVAVVAQVIWIMANRLCPDLIRISLMAACAVVVIVFRAAWLQPVVIASGALFGLAWLRTGSHARISREIFSENLILSRRLAATSLALFAVLLGLSLFWHDGAGGKLADTFARFYRTGSLVFGGGHVVLPLLQAETVRSGLVSHDVFLAGYGAAQALPGPLFTFAAFLGASMTSAYPPWVLGLWCLAAILLPSLLLIVGTLPFWARLTENVQAQAALKGANAAVMGLLLAAFYDPVWKSGMTSPQACALGLAGFALLQFWKIPNWGVVLVCAAAGEWLL